MGDMPGLRRRLRGRPSVRGLLSVVAVERRPPTERRPRQTFDVAPSRPATRRRCRRTTASRHETGIPKRADQAFRFLRGCQDGQSELANRLFRCLSFLGPAGLTRSDLPRGLTASYCCSINCIIRLKFSDPKLTGRTGPGDITGTPSQRDRSAHDDLERLCRRGRPPCFCAEPR